MKTKLGLELEQVNLRLKSAKTRVTIRESALLKPSMNLDVETFHGTSLQGFGDHQK
ncbi:hypothetical protein [Cuspidothrix issatschenkoi]|uniref:hypothetical protein n=1 Tax=Cuspidothrix issatschenkoi TaxID=230752 RepID=UPI001A9C2CA4|nr:hypothetical protein [Cuspidothrix issatschenkoi]